MTTSTLNRLCKTLNSFKNFSTEAIFAGLKSTYTESLEFVNKDTYAPLPVYRVMDENCRIIDEAENPKLTPTFLKKIYKSMVKLNVMDRIFYESQRHGTISFYLTCFGEEGLMIASAAAIDNEDVVYGQYREFGVLMWRGFTTMQFLDQCMGSIDDLGKGRNSPIHYGSKELNYVTISSPISTQISQAVGAAYALRGKNRVAVAYFGEGGAMAADAHAAFSFAPILNVPVIFFCRNNGYAISTPAAEQYAGDGIACRGPAYGINTIRVDGNDVFAVYNVMKKAKEFALRENKPVLIEAMTYRVSHHSTSDDSTAYRSQEEIDRYAKEASIPKFKTYLINEGIWNEEADKAWIDELRQKMIVTINETSKKPKVGLEDTFTDVYKEMPKNLRDQMNATKRHVKMYKERYPKQ